MGEVRQKKFTSDELSGFCTQLSVLLKNGIPLYEGTYLLYKDMEDGDTKAVLEKIDDEVKKGAPLYEALRDTGAFPDYMVNTVRIGEEAGKLPSVMQGLSVYYTREHSVGMGVRNIVVYPTIIFILMAIILSILVFKVLPIFSAVFYELDNRTSGAEQAINITMVASRVVTIVVIALVIALVAFLLRYRFNKGAGALTELLNVIPMTRSMAEELDSSKFLSALALITSNGTETTEATKEAMMVSENPEVIKKETDLLKMLEEGESFDAAIEKAGILEGMDSRMIGVGIKAGCVDEMLSKISENKDEEAGYRMSGISAKIETFLVVALSVIVAIILISIMVPLISVISSI